MITTKNVPNNTITRDLNEFAAPTGNIYETVAIIAKRANQLSIAEKKELYQKLEEFKDSRDNSMEEEFENREQIEISKYYESLPKTTLVAISEFKNGELDYRMAEEEA
ncbi:MAG: DNA-directed RNA polymerase subunit omega [Bacteroidales bacterium]|nr:DNA-directed RNA polymerase subunit omega [Bacteroidales bacterium]